MLKIGGSYYLRIRLLINDIMKDYSKSWCDGEDTLLQDEIFIKLRKLSATLTDAVHIMNSTEEIDEIIDSLGEPESLPEYITGKNKCVL